MTARKRRASQPKIGRPALPEDDVKEVFAMRISAADRRAMEVAASRAGKPLTKWARDILVEYARF